MHYYQHHIGDFIKETACLEDAQTLAYLRMMWRYLDTEKPLPNDAEVLAMQCGTTEKNISLLLRAFFTLENNEWHHKNCNAILAEYQAHTTKKSAAGKISAAKRASAKKSNDEQQLSKSTSNVEQMFNTCLTDVQPNQETNKPLTINQEPETKNQDIDKPAKSGLVNLFFGVSDEVKNDFLALRKVKKAPVTATAIKGIEREAIKAKLTLEQALEICCSNGWTGFKADWLQKNTKQAESFYERDQRLAAERIAEIGTGLVAAKPSTWTPTAIDDDGTFIPF